MYKKANCKNCNVVFQKWFHAQIYCIECKYKKEKEQSKKFRENWWKNLSTERKEEYREKNRQRSKGIKARESLQKYRTTYRYRAKLKLYRYRRSRKIENRILENFRGTLISALKNQSIKKNTRSLKLLGCSIPFLKEYLKKKFTEDMNWSNYGKIWHLDHIIPTSVIDLSKIENQKFVFNYSNLQPMLAKENIIKSNNIKLKIKKNTTLGECQSLISSLMAKFKADLNYEVSFYGEPDYSIIIKFPKVLK